MIIARSQSLRRDCNPATGKSAPVMTALLRYPAIRLTRVGPADQEGLIDPNIAFMLLVATFFLVDSVQADDYKSTCSTFQTL